MCLCVSACVIVYQILMMQIIMFMDPLSRNDPSDLPRVGTFLKAVTNSIKDYERNYDLFQIIVLATSYFKLIYICMIYLSKSVVIE